jgi:hypothetical protein
MIRFPASRNQAALEQFVGNWRGNAVDECRTQRRIAAQELHNPLLHWGRRLGTLGGKRGARRRLIFFDYPLRHLLHDRVLRLSPAIGDAEAKQPRKDRENNESSIHDRLPLRFMLGALGSKQLGEARLVFRPDEARMHRLRSSSVSRTGPA